MKFPSEWRLRKGKVVAIHGSAKPGPGDLPPWIILLFVRALPGVILDHLERYDEIIDPRCALLSTSEDDLLVKRAVAATPVGRIGSGTAWRVWLAERGLWHHVWRNHSNPTTRPQAQKATIWPTFQAAAGDHYASLARREKRFRTYEGERRGPLLSLVDLANMEAVAAAWALTKDP